MKGTRCAISPATNATSGDSRSSFETRTLHFAVRVVSPRGLRAIDRARRRVLGKCPVKYVHRDCGFWVLKRGTQMAKSARWWKGRDLYWGGISRVFVTELGLPGRRPLIRQLRRKSRHSKTAAKGHVWTAPSWQELSSRMQGWSVQPCVRPLDAVHMTAGPNAVRGSGPGQNPAFDDAVALVGCPDRRIDRLCITCCSLSQPSHHAGCCPTRSRYAASAAGSL